MPRFRIEYINPETNEAIKEVIEFEDTASVSAQEWAEDYAYTVADKGAHEVTQLHEKQLS